MKIDIITIQYLARGFIKVVGLRGDTICLAKIELTKLFNFEYLNNKQRLRKSKSFVPNCDLK